MKLLPTEIGYYATLWKCKGSPYGTAGMTLYFDGKNFRYHPRQDVVENYRILKWAKTFDELTNKPKSKE